MSKIKKYKNLRERINAFLGKKSNSDNVSFFSESLSRIHPEHGFQVLESDLHENFRNFFTKEQLLQHLDFVNLFGYLASEMGFMLKSLFDNPEYDIYIKSVHDSQVNSIFDEGIRCYGHGGSFSLSTVNPKTFNDVSLEHTISLVNEFSIFIQAIKSHYGYSQGMKVVNGTIVLQLPKKINLEDVLYFNKSSETFNIKPEFIVGFVPVNENNIVEGVMLRDSDISFDSNQVQL